MSYGDQNNRKFIDRTSQRVIEKYFVIGKIDYYIFGHTNENANILIRAAAHTPMFKKNVYKKYFLLCGWCIVKTSNA